MKQISYFVTFAMSFCASMQSMVLMQQLDEFEKKIIFDEQERIRQADCLKQAKQAQLLESILRGSVSEIEELICEGADLNEHDAAGDTPLMYAVLTKDLQKIIVLNRHGARLDAQNKHGQTAYDWAKNFGEKYHGFQGIITYLELCLQNEKTVDLTLRLRIARMETSIDF